MLDEADHDLLQRLARHLAVGHGDPGLGRQFSTCRAIAADGHDPVVDQENLAPPLQLPADRLLDNQIVIAGDKGLDRAPLLRRRGDHRQVADAQQRHLQRPGDRGGGQGQDIDPGADFLDFFLMGDPETVLLIDDQQTELLKNNILGQQAMGADDDVYPALGQLPDDLLLPGRGAEPVEAGHGDRKEAEPVAEGGGMLLGQHRGRHQHRHLIAVFDGLEGGADRHFGLAVADIAADQPVHGPGAGRGRR